MYSTAFDTVVKCDVNFLYFDPLWFLARNSLVTPLIFNTKERGLAHYILWVKLVINKVSASMSIIWDIDSYMIHMTAVWVAQINGAYHGVGNHISIHGPAPTRWNNLPGKVGTKIAITSSRKIYI